MREGGGSDIRVSHTEILHCYSTQHALSVSVHTALCITKHQAVDLL